MPVSGQLAVRYDSITVFIRKITITTIDERYCDLGIR